MLSFSSLVDLSKRFYTASHINQFIHTLIRHFLVLTGYTVLFLYYTPMDAQEAAGGVQGHFDMWSRDDKDRTTDLPIGKVALSSEHKLPR